MLSHHFSVMSEQQFQSLPNTTNAVESHNRLSKADQPEMLKIAMLTTYKIDMSMTLEHMANREGMATNYGDSTKWKRRKLEIEESDKDKRTTDKRKHFEPDVNISTVIFKCLSCSKGMD